MNYGLEEGNKSILFYFILFYTYDGSDELIGHTHLMSHLLVSLPVSPPVHMATSFYQLCLYVLKIKICL
jgi:hypothetical protein